MNSEAQLSECRRYRYWLRRTWDESLPVACFIGLNPSTADETNDDATIRKCIGFAKRWNCGGLLMLNLFAWRATKPADMKKAQNIGNDIVGVQANTFQHLIGYINDRPCSHLVAAWGSNGGMRGREAVAWLGSQGISYLRLNNDGSPEHPLYIPYETPLTNFRQSSEAQKVAPGVGISEETDTV